MSKPKSNLAFIRTLLPSVTMLAMAAISMALPLAGASIPQTISFSAPSTASASSTLTLTAKATSGLSVSYSASPKTVCTVSGSVATFLTAGSCSLTASQAGNSTYAAAVSVTKTITVSLATQTITFSAPSTATAGSTLTLGATASSGLAVGYSASPSTVCTVSGGIASFVAAGSCSLTASQAGNSTYAAAVSVTKTIAVSLATQTITFSAPSTATAGSTLTLGATASSGLAVGYSASPANVCTVSGGIASFVAAGSCSLTASQAGNSTYAAAVSVKKTIAVSLATQTITFSAPSTATAGSTLTLGATASSGLAVGYSASPATVCTVSGGIATFVAAGSCSLTASQAGNSTYAAAVSVTKTIAVSLATQTITFSAPSTATAGSTLTLGATASSGLAVGYSASPATVCTVSGGIATFVAAGSCSLTASQAGNSTYAAAPSVTRITTVSSAQTITFAPPLTATAGSTLTLGATASSGLAVSYTANPSNVCSISGNVATFLAAGSCTITASQAGNATYAAATPVSPKISVSLATQTITFAPPSTATVGSTLTLGATASSGLAVSYTAGPSTVCTVSGSLATFLTAGACSLTASQAGNVTYAAAASVTKPITVSLASQTITFNAPLAATVGSTLALTAKASSGLPVSYAASPSTVCTVSSSVTTFLASGSCTLTASQAGNPTYAAATSVTQTINVSLAPQTITFTAPLAATVSSTLALTATASSGLPVNYAASPSTVCTVSSSVTTFLASGSCTLTASQAGNPTYAAATPVTDTITVTNVAVNPLTTGCVFIMDQQATGSFYPFSPGSGSSFVSGCDVWVNSVVNSLNVSGSGVSARSFNVAGTASGALLANGSVSPAPAFGSPVAADPLAFLNAPNAGPCTATSANITTATTLSPGTYCNGLSISGAAVTLNPGLYIIAGPLTIQSGANVTGTGVTFYLTEPSGSTTYGPLSINNATVNIAAPTSSAAGSIPGVVFFADRNWVQTGAQGVTVNYSYVSADGFWYFPYTGIAANGSTVKCPNFGGLVVDNITGSAATWSFPAANNLSILGPGAGPQPQTITFSAPSTALVGSILTLTATANSALAVTYAASPATVCTVSGNVATFLAAGSCSITASQAGNANYAAALSVTQTISVSLATQTITFTLPSQTTAGAILNLAATATSGLPVTYAASPATVCTVSGNALQFVAAGTCSVTAAQPGNASYAAASPVSQSISVSNSSSNLLTTGCVFIMNPQATGSFYPFEPGAYSGFGAGCDVDINSTANSLKVQTAANGSARSFNIAGPASGASGSFNPAPTFGSPVIADPLAFLDPPPAAPCTATDTAIKSTTTLSPGVYCGGLTINGAQVTLNPGLYVIMGPLVVEGGASVTGTGVTFYLTAPSGTTAYGSVSIVNATMSLTAPSATATLGIPGVVFWGDRNWVQRGGQGVTISASVVSTDGFWYFLNTGISSTGSTLQCPHFGGLVVDNAVGGGSESWSFAAADNSTLVANGLWLGATPTALSFGSPVGLVSAPQTVTLSNAGSAAITITGASVSGANAADFKLANGCGSTLSVGASCSISVTFQPSVSGSESATLLVGSNAATGTISVAMTGFGETTNLGVTPTALSYGGPVGVATGSQTVLVSTLGGLPVTISSVSVSGGNAADFALTNGCNGTLAGGATCAISITFTPSQTGQETATLSISSNAANGPQTVALTGNGPVHWTMLGPANIMSGLDASGVAGTCSDAVYMGGNPSSLMISGSNNNSAAGIRMTQDGGATWTFGNSGLADMHITDLAVDTAAPNSYFASSFNGIFHTANNGATWQTTSYSTASLGGPEFSLFWININGSQTLVTGSSMGIALSAAGSNTWTLQSPPAGPRMIYTLSGAIASNGDTVFYASVDPRDPNYSTVALYQVTVHNGVWTWVASPLSYIQVSVDPSNPLHIIGTGFGTYQVRQSFDGGQTDSLLTDSSGHTFGAWFVNFDQRDATGKTMWFAGQGILSYSTDGGQTWKNPIHTFTTGQNYSFSMGADNQRIIFAGSSDTLVCSDQGLFRLNAQNSLDQLSALVEDSIAVAAAVSHIPGNPATNFLVNLWDWSPTASWDGGQTWPATVGQYWWLDTMGTGSPSGGEGGEFFTMNAGQDGNAHALEMVNQGYTMYYSADGGHTFSVSTLDQVTSGHSRNFVFDSFSSAQVQTLLGFQDTGTVYIGANDYSGSATTGMVIVSTNYGASWSPLSSVPIAAGEPISTLGVDPFNANHLLVSTLSHLLQSSDGGNTWTSAALPGNTHSGLYPMTWSRSSQGTIAALNYGGEFMLSQDGGTTWHVISPPIPTNAAPKWISYSPASNSLVVIATSQFPAVRSILLSHDNGNTWRDITGDIQSTFLNRATWDGNDFYIATSGQGLVRLSGVNAH